MGRSPCCSKEGLNRGAWSAHEDQILTDYIKANGDGKWRDLPKKAGLKRCGKSCRLRWVNYLRPDIKRGNIASDEEDLIIKLHNLLGNRWSLIAGRLPGRTDNEIKNYWNKKFGERVITREEKARAPQVSLGEQSHQVVRTKAVKCNEVYVHSSQGFERVPNDTNPLNLFGDKKLGKRVITREEKARAHQVTLGEQSHQVVRTKAARCNKVYVHSSQGYTDPSNLFGDYDFTGPELGCHGSDCEANMSLDFADLPFSFGEDMIQDWRGSGCFDSNVASNLEALTTLLDSEGE